MIWQFRGVKGRMIWPRVGGGPPPFTPRLNHRNTAGSFGARTPKMRPSPAAAAAALAAAATLVGAQNGPTLILNACSPGAAKYQQFTQSSNGTKLWLTATSGNNPPMCLDIEDFNTKPGATGACVCTWGVGGRRGGGGGGRTYVLTP